MSDDKPMAEVRKDMGLPPATKPRQKTDVEIKDLVLDIANGRVFADFMIPETAGQNAVGLVFMPIALMPPPDLEKLVMEEEASMIYEYLEKAGPRSVNGMPGFFSFKYLNRADHDFFADQMQKYIELQMDFLGEQDDGPDTVGSTDHSDDSTDTQQSDAEEASENDQGPVQQGVEP